MKSRFSILAILVLVAVLAAPADAGDLRKIGPFAATDLLVGTSAVNDTIGTIDIGRYDFVGFQVEVDVTSGGSSGGATMYFEGSVDTLTWMKLWLVEYSDSCLVDQTLTMSSTADLKFAGVISAMPYDLRDAYYTMSGFLECPIPFMKIRAIIVDTNWNAAAGVDLVYIVRERE